MRHLTAACAGAVFFLGLAGQLRAQGNLSTFGFGYPPGQLSARAQATGGGVGELDPASTLNPAALVNWGSSAVYFQVEPEFRTVSAPSISDRTTTARYPLTTGALQLGSRWVTGISWSTFLDRSWATRSRTTHQLGGVVGHEVSHDAPIGRRGRRRHDDIPE